MLALPSSGGVAVSKVVVMIEDDDGRRDWWEIFDVEQVAWDLLAPGPRGSRANMVVRGSFYRRRAATETLAPPERDELERGGGHGPQEDR